MSRDFDTAEVYTTVVYMSTTAKDADLIAEQLGQRGQREPNREDADAMTDEYIYTGNLLDAEWAPVTPRQRLADGLRRAADRIGPDPVDVTVTLAFAAAEWRTPAGRKSNRALLRYRLRLTADNAGVGFFTRPYETVVWSAEADWSTGRRVDRIVAEDSPEARTAVVTWTAKARPLTRPPRP